MEKLYDRKWIEVEEVDHADTTWGARYHLYVDKKGNYYADLDDDARELTNIGSAYKQIEEQEAKESFAEYIEELEKAQNEE